MRQFWYDAWYFLRNVQLFQRRPGARSRVERAAFGCSTGQPLRSASSDEDMVMVSRGSTAGGADETRSQQDQPTADAQGHRFGAAFRAQLSEDRRDVKLDSVLGDRQPRSNLLVTQTSREHL